MKGVIVITCRIACPVLYDHPVLFREVWVSGNRMKLSHPSPYLPPKIRIWERTHSWSGSVRGKEGGLLSGRSIRERRRREHLVAAGRTAPEDCGHSGGYTPVTHFLYEKKLFLFFVQKVNPLSGPASELFSEILTVMWSWTDDHRRVWLCRDACLNHGFLEGGCEHEVPVPVAQC